MRSLRQQFDHCKHFTGIGNDQNGKRIGGMKRGTCKAMVNYDDVCKSGSRGICLPCLTICGDSVPVDGIAPICLKREMKTAPELDQEEKEFKEYTDKVFTRTVKARIEILAHAKWDINKPYQRESGASGTIECPVCKGKLDYSIAGYNGHVHAHCHTPNCVSWME